MRPTIPLRDIVGEALHRLLVAIVPLHGNFNRHAIPLTHCVEHLRVQGRLVPVHILHKARHTTGERKILFFARTFVVQDNADPIIEKGQLANPLSQQLIVELNLAKGFF